MRRTATVVRIGPVGSRRATAARDVLRRQREPHRLAPNSSGYFDGRAKTDSFPWDHAHYQVSTKPGQPRGVGGVVLACRFCSSLTGT